MFFDPNTEEVVLRIVFESGPGGARKLADELSVAMWAGQAGIRKTESSRLTAVERRGGVVGGVCLRNQVVACSASELGASRFAKLLADSDALVLGEGSTVGETAALLTEVLESSGVPGLVLSRKTDATERNRVANAAGEAWSEADVTDLRHLGVVAVRRAVAKYAEDLHKDRIRNLPKFDSAALTQFTEIEPKPVKATPSRPVRAASGVPQVVKPSPSRPAARTPAVARDPGRTKTRKSKSRPTPPKIPVRSGTPPPKPPKTPAKVSKPVPPLLRFAKEDPPAEPSLTYSVRNERANRAPPLPPRLPDVSPAPPEKPSPGQHDPAPEPPAPTAKASKVESEPPVEEEAESATTQTQGRTAAVTGEEPGAVVQSVADNQTPRLNPAKIVAKTDDFDRALAEAWSDRPAEPITSVPAPLSVVPPAGPVSGQLARPPSEELDLPPTGWFAKIVAWLRSLLRSFGLQGRS